MIPTLWNKETYIDFINYLFSYQDLKYKSFNEKLVINSKYEIIGIRIPTLRKIAKDVAKTNIEDYLNLKKVKYFEEIMIEGLVISTIKDEKLFYKYFKKYINKIDNWALCDTFSSSIKIVSKYADKYFNICTKLIDTHEEFKTRLGLVMILNYFITEERIDIILDIINNINSDKYYINMARAWLLAEVYLNNKDKTIKFLQNNKLDKFTQNKAISKINDSYRVTKEEKELLKSYKK